MRVTLTLLPRCPGGGMADATDLKSVIRKGVRVRVPPRVPLQNHEKMLYYLINRPFLFCKVSAIVRTCLLKYTLWLAYLSNHKQPHFVHHLSLVFGRDANNPSDEFRFFRSLRISSCSAQAKGRWLDLPDLHLCPLSVYSWGMKSSLYGGLSGGQW